MARIRIKDLPKKAKISKEEMKKVLGGYTTRLSSSSAALVRTSPGMVGDTVGMVSTMTYRPLLGSQFAEVEEDEEVQT